MGKEGRDKQAVEGEVVVDEEVELLVPSFLFSP